MIGRAATGYLWLEILRMLRDVRYVALAVLAPIGFYLLFATLFGGTPTQPGQLPGRVEIMVAMAAYGAMWAALSTTGPRIAQERDTGWLTQIRAMPLSAGSVLAARIVAGVLLALPAIGLVCLVAALVKGVHLAGWQWAGLIGALWLGTAPFAVLGVAIGYAIGADAAYALCYGTYMAMSAMGGLWVPPAVLPSSLRRVAGALPSNRLADLGWQIAGRHPIRPSSVAVLAAWAAGLGVLAVLAYLRPGIRRRGSRPAPSPAPPSRA